jgi:O-acetylserine/cysteine efflux transporter
MKRSNWILALLVVAIWGMNFTVTKIGLGNIPPMLLAAARFTFVAFPAILFVKRPAIEWRYCLAYGLTIGVGHFSCLFYAIYIGLPAGLASVILQSQSFITILLATLILKESLKLKQIFGLVVAVSGLATVGLAMNRSGSGNIPVSALFLTVLSAFFWSLATLVIKSAANRTQERGIKLDMFSMVAWSALVPPLPLLAMSFFMDGSGKIMDALRHLSLTSMVCVLFMAWVTTLFATGTWNYLISKHHIGSLASLTLLVPVAGLLIARIVLDERLSTLQWIGSLAIIFGLVIFNFGLMPFVKIIKRQKHPISKPRP